MQSFLTVYVWGKKKKKPGFEDGEVGIFIVGPGKVCGRGFTFAASEPKDHCI